MSSSGLSSKRIILSPFTKEFRGEGHSYESLTFSEATPPSGNNPIYFLDSGNECLFQLSLNQLAN